jgi:protein-tyrosine phosphatase
MEGFIDIHSHILPDMDDGSDSIEETMEILKTAYSEGIRTMIATPHSYSEGSGNIVEDIDRRLEEIRKIADRPPIEIYKGCEIYYTHEVPELLSEKKLPVLAGSRYVLVEFSPVTEYIYITNALRNIMLAGYSPIVAHVERYMAVTKEIGRIEELIDMGAYIQVNAKSITGESF